MLNTISTEFLSFMDKGGPIMWVIFVTAGVAIIMLIERALRINAWKKQAIFDQYGFEQKPDYSPIKYYSANRSPIALLHQQLDWKNIHNKLELQKQIKIQMSKLMPTLEGTLPTIAIIATILPMLGLLGTVTGMIQVFETIALHGTGDSQQMAGGISQALLTTASGLIIAIPVIFMHHLLVKRLRTILALTEQSIHALVKQKSSDLK